LNCRKLFLIILFQSFANWNINILSYFIPIFANCRKLFLIILFQSFANWRKLFILIFIPIFANCRKLFLIILFQSFANWRINILLIFIPIFRKLEEIIYSYFIPIFRELEDKYSSYFIPIFRKLEDKYSSYFIPIIQKLDKIIFPLYLPYYVKIYLNKLWFHQIIIDKMLKIVANFGCELTFKKYPNLSQIVENYLFLFLSQSSANCRKLFILIFIPIFANWNINILSYFIPIFRKL
jgi:hypothetical protein